MCFLAVLMALISLEKKKNDEILVHVLISALLKLEFGHMVLMDKDLWLMQSSDFCRTYLGC